MAPPLTIFEQALDKYKQTVGNPLSKKDEKILNTTSFNDLLSEVLKAEGLHSTNGKTRKVIKRLLPFLNALNRFGGIVDVCIQANPSPASLIWGGIRLLLLVSRDCGIFFDGLVDMMEKIGDAFPRLDAYTSMFPQSRLDDIVLAAYGHAVSFLTMASRTFSTNGLKTLMRSLWKPLLREFESTVESLNRQVSIADAEFNLLVAQSAQGEKTVAAAERTEQSKERVLAIRERQSQSQERQLQSSERQRADAERAAQAAERLRQQSLDRENAAQELKRVTKEADQHQADVMNWLSRVDTDGPLSFALSKHRDNPNSCKWIFDNPRYREWRSASDPSHALWISSGPGTGKTILAGHIINELQRLSGPASPVLYFFCTASNVSLDDAGAPLRTLICQLLDQLPEIPAHIEHEYQTQMRKGIRQVQKLPLLTIQDLFLKTVELFPTIHIVIDGLDEVKERAEILGFLEALGRRGANDSIRILVCCRAEIDIRQHLNGFAKIRIRPVNTKADVDSFVSKSVMTLPFQDQERAKNTVQFLQDRASGVFVWVRLVTELLKTSTTAADYDETLVSIPLDLHQLYCLIIEKLHDRIGKFSNTRKRLMQNLFRWLALSPRPLLVSELREALAATYDPVADGDSYALRISEDFKPSESSLLSFCGTLVNEDEGVISLLHHSAQEFLLGSEGERSEIVKSYMVSADEGHTDIGVLCLDYLETIEPHMRPLFSDEQLPFGSAQDSKVRNTLKTQILAAFPLYELTCHQWAYHLERIPLERADRAREAFSRFESCTSWFQGWALFHPEGCVPNSKLFRKLRRYGRDICSWIDLIDVLLGPFQAQTFVDLVVIGRDTADLSTSLQERRAVSVVRIPDAQVFLERQILLGNAAMVRKLLNLKRLSYETVRRGILLAKSKHELQILGMLCEYCISHEQSPTAFELARQHNDEEVSNVLEEHIKMCASSDYYKPKRTGYDWGVYYAYRENICRPRIESDSELLQRDAEARLAKERQDAEARRAVKSMQTSKLAKALAQVVQPSSDELRWLTAAASDDHSLDPATLTAMRTARGRLGRQMTGELDAAGTAPRMLQTGSDWGSFQAYPGNSLHPTTDIINLRPRSPGPQRIWRKLRIDFHPWQEYLMFTDASGANVRLDFEAALAGQFTISRVTWLLKHQRRVSLACGLILSRHSEIFSMDEPLYVERFSESWKKTRCLSFEVGMMMQPVGKDGSRRVSLMPFSQASTEYGNVVTAPISPVSAEDVTLTSDVITTSNGDEYPPQIVALKEIQLSSLDGEQVDEQQKYRLAVQLYMIVEHPDTGELEIATLAQWVSLEFKIAHDRVHNEAGDQIERHAALNSDRCYESGRPSGEISMDAFGDACAPSSIAQGHDP